MKTINWLWSRWASIKMLNIEHYLIENMRLHKEFRLFQSSDIHSDSSFELQTEKKCKKSFTYSTVNKHTQKTENTKTSFSSRNWTKIWTHTKSISLETRHTVFVLFKKRCCMCTSKQSTAEYLSMVQKSLALPVASTEPTVSFDSLWYLSSPIGRTLACLVPNCFLSFTV